LSSRGPSNTAVIVSFWSIGLEECGLAHQNGFTAAFGESIFT
jgi:hypothetical protein